MDTIRVGRISSLNYEDGTARIVYNDRDKAVTAELPLLSHEYFMPKVDDMVMVLHLPNGSEAGLVLGRYWCKSNRPTESGDGIYRKEFCRDHDCYLRCENHEMTMEAATTLNLVAGSSLNITAPTITLNGALTVNGNQTNTGTITATGEVTASGIALSTHTHTSAGEGETSSAPN